MKKRTLTNDPTPHETIKALGERLRLARRHRRMTQTEMADRVGVSIPTLGKLEHGDPTIALATLFRVLSVLDLADDLDKLAADDYRHERRVQQALFAPTHATGRRIVTTVLPVWSKP